MAAQLAEKYGRSSCMQNLSGKLRRGTFSYTEAVEIADILGYDTALWFTLMMPFSISTSHQRRPVISPTRIPVFAII